MLRRIRSRVSGGWLTDWGAGVNIIVDGAVRGLIADLEIRVKVALW